MTQLIAREHEEVTENYEQIEQIFLKRYKLSAEMFRLMFIKHSKNADGTLKNSVHEIRNYFQEWIKGFEVETFEQLCDLMISDQMKRRVPTQVKEHFIDEWPKFKSSELLSEKLDQYERVWNVLKRKKVSHDNRDKYSSYRKKKLAFARGATKEPNQENLERFKNSKVNEGFELKNSIESPFLKHEEISEVRGNEALDTISQVKCQECGCKAFSIKNVSDINREILEDTYFCSEPEQENERSFREADNTIIVEVELIPDYEIFVGKYSVINTPHKFFRNDEAREYLFLEKIEADIIAIPPGVDELTDSKDFDDESATIPVMPDIAGTTEI
ncbi:hypothetical protein AVEN_1477-1 [Araneus ventricosus]|uniref:Uncharacterized protein n=1 Tax=Araneus ventricosus TaxID=182803 RepID=A0A4Y2M510_ARAVE|nr:hypothetical protein AVEN_1477-1 [Araneus ventricosus]